MPTYVFRCPTCEAVQEQFCRVSEMEANRPTCHGPMQTVIQAVAGFVQMECHYRCPVTRQGVTSWKQRKEIFAAKNLSDGSDVSADQVIAAAQKKKAANDKLAAGMPFAGQHPAF